jgi:energy-coupling factor transporter ATP-binding protein EcfA2
MAVKENSTGIPVLSWFDEPIRHSVFSVFHDLDTATEAIDLFRKYRRKQFASLKSSLGKIKILGMSQPVPLVDIYSPAYVSTTIHGRLYEQDWHSLKEGKTRAVTHHSTAKSDLIQADEFIEKHNRVVVLGSAGSGKTTLLRHIALAYSDKDVFASTKLKTSKFPIFVSLLGYTQRKDSRIRLLNYMIKELESKTDENAEYFIKRLFDKGLAVILLDGLDEVPLSLRSDLIEEIQSICTTYPECSMIISCRTADYIGTFEEFYEVELAKLAKHAVHKIIEAWFGNDSKKIKKLKAHLRRDEGLQSLTETPLLLSLLCIQFRYDLALPTRKTELYKRCVDAFLRDWDASRGFRRDSLYTNLSDERKERIFEHVAGTFFSDQVQYTFPESDLVKIIGECCRRFDIAKDLSGSVLAEIERHHGILERCSADSFMFSHPSFQEYFAARYLISKRREFERIKKNFENPKWASTIEFIVAMHDDPVHIIRFLQEQSTMSNLKNYPAMARRTRHLWLLYRCMNTGAALEPSVRREAYAHIVDSQIQMSQIYEHGGVFPVAVLVTDGVRHSYVYFRKRPTLYDALQPFRLLANEILLSSSEDYADIVLKRLKTLESSPEFGTEVVSSWALVLSLVIPLASIRPDDVLAWLDKVNSAKAAHSFFGQWVKESKGVLPLFRDSR